MSELDAYIKGGSTLFNDQLREAYGHIGRPKARKMSKYLLKFLQDEW